MPYSLGTDRPYHRRTFALCWQFQLNSDREPHYHQFCSPQSGCNTEYAQFLIQSTGSRLMQATITDIAILFLDIPQAILERLRRFPDSSEYADCWITYTRTWHHTLSSLLSARTTNAAHYQMKERALHRWRSFGASFGMQENVDVISLAGPSTPSSALSHRRIPKRCYYQACPCNVSHPCHRVHLCKGCRRVLYCGSKCQRLCVTQSYSQ